MSGILKFEQAVKLLQEALEESYARGKADAIDAMVQAVSGNIKSSAPSQTLVANNELENTKNSVHERVRAPRGSAERVIKRAIAFKNDSGVTVAEIMSAREGDLEKMLVESSIRGELKRGEKLTPPRYTEVDGKWYFDPV